MPGADRSITKFYFKRSMSKFYYCTGTRSRAIDHDADANDRRRGFDTYEDMHGDPTMTVPNLPRRGLLKWGTAATLGSQLPFAFAQTALPKGPLSLVVPFAAGGATDVVSRLIAQRLSERIGRSDVIENVGGGGGAIGGAMVTSATACGST